MRVSRLSLALLALAMLLAVQLERALDRAAPDGAAPLLAAAKALPPPPGLATPPLEHYGAMVARPLFSASRRPVTRKQPLVAHSQTSPPDARLVGVLLTEEMRMALLTEGGKPPRRLAVGQEVDGWTIAAIEPRRVLLRQGGLDHELLLAKPKMAGPAPGRRQLQKR